jgi:hypothetical protein
VGRCPRTLPLSRESDSGRQLGGRLVLPRLASGNVARMLLGEPKSPVILRNPRQSAAQNRLREVAGSKPAAPIRKKACYRAAFLRWGGPATRVDDGLNIAILPMCAQKPVERRSLWPAASVKIPSGAPDWSASVSNATSRPQRPQGHPWHLCAGDAQEGWRTGALASARAWG